MRLLIVSAATHYQHGSKIYGYGAYALEIEIWADLFSEVVIAAPCRTTLPPEDYLVINRPNISLIPQMETGGPGLRSKALQLLLLPALVWGLIRAMRRADAIHVRCPGNLSLLGVLLAPLFSKYLVAKYAGQWSGYPGESWAWRLQNRLLRSRWWRGPVTVYGRWPNQSKNIVPFFTSVLTTEQMERARAVATAKSTSEEMQVLYVGRLSTQKNVHTLLEATARLRRKSIPIKCSVIGDGEQQSALKTRASELGISDSIVFVGSVSFERVLDFYERADVLVLVSESEGWPKAITEGMAFGLVCVGSNRGLIPEILDEGRGLLVPPGDVDELAKVLEHIANFPHEYMDLRQRAAAWSQQYSLDGLREALRELLSQKWNLSITMNCEFVGAQSEKFGHETH